MEPKHYNQHVTRCIKCRGETIEYNEGNEEKVECQECGLCIIRINGEYFKV
jgi:ribosomal protein S27E